MTESSIYIGAGDYRIVTQGKNNLYALLGTCTGVALYDREAGVGGICHILLPDYPDHDYSWAPKVYATSCLSLLFQDLLKAGAEQAGMEAVVAGGCLPGSCTTMDINLDIGGRTRECVNQFLAYHNIPIVNSKTGGCLGMTLSLDTSDWQAVITPLTTENHVIKGSPVAPARSRLKEDICRLSPVPQVVLKALRLIADDNYHFSEITRELSRDQVLSAKVISFCNSAFVGAPVRIDSIGRAVLHLGETRLLEIILATSLKDFYNHEKEGYSLIRGGLFKHSIVVAFLTEIISDYSEKVDKQTAYSSGLIHDIGKVVLDQYVAENISLFYDQGKNMGTSGLEKERDILSTDHQEMGRELAVKWNLPETLTEAVSLHHEPEKRSCNPELIHMVYLADILASTLMTGISIKIPDDGSLNNSVDRLGLDLTDIEQIISRVPWNTLGYL